MDNKDFDIDKLFDDQNAFKPLTKGLGFHHSLKSEEEVNTNLKKSSEMLRNDLEKRAKSLNTNITTNDTSLDRGELAAFYSNTMPTVENLKKPEEITLKLSSTSKASMTKRFGAYAIDFLVVAAMYLVTLVAILVISPLGMDALTSKEVLSELLKLTAPLAVFFYLFYFSFLDKTSYSTLGKRLLSLKVQDERGQEISMYQAFLRSFLTLISFVSLGLFSLLDFQSKMTETKVVMK